MNGSDKTIQFAAAAIVAGVAAYGFKKRGIAAAAGILGAGIAAQELVLLAGGHVFPIAAREVREAVEVAASPQAAFELWTRFEEFPRFLAGVKEVQRLSERRLRWVTIGALGQRVEWEAEITAAKPARLVAWRSTTPGIVSGAKIHFEPAPLGARVLAVRTYGQPPGPLAALVARIKGGGPRAAARRDLLRFKQLIEDSASQPAAALQPIGSAIRGA